MTGKKSDGNLVGVDVTGKAEIKVTDVAGLGTAAKSPAGLEIARAIGVPLGNAIDTAATALFGRRAAQVKAEGRLIEARSASEAKIIEVETEEQIRRFKATSRRVRTEEMRKTDYIETTAKKAILLADAHVSEGVAPLGEELTLAWVDGVKETHSEEVRNLFASILANQTKAGANSISGPSLALLRNLDTRLAIAFKRFVAAYCTLGCYPHMEHTKVTGNLKLDDEELSLLIEIGFLQATNNDCYRIGGLRFSSQRPIGYLHGNIVFTRRSFELAKAIFGSDPLGGDLKEYIQTPEQFSDMVLDILNNYGKDFPGDYEIQPVEASDFVIQFISGLDGVPLSTDVVRDNGDLDTALRAFQSSKVNGAALNALAQFMNSNKNWIFST